MEACSILDQRYGRSDLVKAVGAILYPLQPTGGLLAFPEFDWHALYTTNFDRLVELAYKRAGKEIAPVRSNFEYGRPEASDAPPLFKVHGCITQDIVDGSFTRMVLTERDYEEYRQFRETIWNRLALDLTTKDVVVVGYSAIPTSAATWYKPQTCTRPKALPDGCARSFLSRIPIVRN